MATVPNTGPMAQKASEGRSGLIRPTETQIRTNTIVIPKAFIDVHKEGLRWFQGFDVLIGDVRIANRKLDSENRVGGLRLTTQFSYGDVLQVEVIDERTLRVRKADQVALGFIASPRTRTASATSP